MLNEDSGVRARRSATRVGATTFASLLLLLGGASAAQNSPVGVWKLQVQWIGGPADVTLTVNQIGNELYAAWEGPRGKLAVREVAFEDDVLSFVLPVQDQNGASVELRFEGTIDGDAIDGKILLRNGTEIDVDGRRDSGAAPPPIAAPLHDLVDKALEACVPSALIRCGVRREDPLSLPAAPAHSWPPKRRR